MLLLSLSFPIRYAYFPLVSITFVSHRALPFTFAIPFHSSQFQRQSNLEATFLICLAADHQPPFSATKGDQRTEPKTMRT